MQLRGCGSSFVANVGEATSRGFDVDAEIRPMQGLLFQLAVGYNKSTYDETLLSSPNAAGVRAVIVNKGNSVGTAGISPWQVAAAVQYDAPVNSDIDGYARVDYQYSARETNPIALRDPVTSSYSPSAIPLPTQNYVTMRAGVRTGDIDVSLFINNLLDEAPAIARLNYGYTNNLIHQTRTLRPRTVGLTLSYRR
ncbi:TonB-dependent receptor-like protein [Sphingomonas sp. BK235]|nr:TonB-dependent receptor-like protein [Sphingomonas sp. BK235]